MSHIENIDQTVSFRILRMKELQTLTGLSRSYLYHLAKEGSFPKPISLVPGGSSKGWLESEVLTWISERIAEREEV